MAATQETIYKELKLLRTEIHELKNLLVPEVEPEEDEINTIIEGEKEFNSGEYTDWKAIKASKQNVQCCFNKKSCKEFYKVPGKLQNRCGEIFDELEYSFAPIRLNVKKLRGYENTYRIRVGSWRIIYKVDNNEKSIVIYDILPRKSAY